MLLRTDREIDKLNWPANIIISTSHEFNVPLWQ